MATEGRGWDTSTAHIRRTFKACIAYGRRAQGREGADLWEAFRLLGTGLHTMEDLLAHSNWCEIALRKMGHEQVFCHVGENGRHQVFGEWGMHGLMSRASYHPYAERFCAPACDGHLRQRRLPALADGRSDRVSTLHPRSYALW